MMKRVVLLGLAALVVGLAGTAARLLTAFEEPAVDPAWLLGSSPEIPEGSVTVRYTETSTLLFSDGETDWKADGWFSRFGPLEFTFCEIEPNAEAIARSSNFINDSGGDQTLQFLKTKEASHPELEFSTLPRFDEIVLLRAS